MQLPLLQETVNANQSGPSAVAKPELNSDEKQCSVQGCETHTIIVLGEKPFCLQHFILHCYEWMDQLEPAVRDKSRSATETAKLKNSVEECSNRALLVSLRCETLTNLDRSRLLDILLRSSDLLFMLRIPGFPSAWLPVRPTDAAKSQRSKKISPDSPFRTKAYGA